MSKMQDDRQVATRLSPDEGDALEALARANLRSVAAEARVAIRKHLESNAPAAHLPASTAGASTKGE